MDLDHIQQIRVKEYNMVFGQREFIKVINKNLGYGHKIKSKEFKRIMDVYYTKIRDRIIYDNYEYKIPNVGYISLIKEKIVPHYSEEAKRVVGMCIDYQASKEFKKIIYLENEHTNGFTFKYIINKMRLKNVNTFRFRVSKYTMNRYLTSKLKNQDKYGVIEAPVIKK